MNTAAVSDVYYNITNNVYYIKMKKVDFFFILKSTGLPVFKTTRQIEVANKTPAADDGNIL